MRILLFIAIVIGYFVIKAYIHKNFRNTKWFKKLDKYGSFITWMIFCLIFLGIIVTAVITEAPKVVIGIFSFLLLIAALFCVIGYPKE